MSTLLVITKGYGVLATYIWRMRNNNLAIIIAGSSCPPQWQIIFQTWKAILYIESVYFKEWTEIYPLFDDLLSRSSWCRFALFINNYSSSPNGLWVNEGERNNCFSKIQLVGKKYRDETTLARKTRFSRHCFGFQIRRFLLLVGYNIYPGSSSTNQNAALIIDH